MHSERAQIVLKVSPLTGADTFYVKEALEQLEGVRSAYVDISQGLVKVDGAVTDTELLQTLSALGKSGIVVTHTRGVPGPPPSRPQSTGVLKVTAAPFVLCPPRLSPSSRLRLRCNSSTSSSNDKSAAARESSRRTVVPGGAPIGPARGRGAAMDISTVSLP